MVKIYKNTIKPVKKYIKGKKILDIGCCGMGANDKFNGCDFIHSTLKKDGYDVTGLDINKAGVDFLNKKGFNIVHHDAQEPYDLKEKFDTILSEENIEHVCNLKTYLQNIRKHLEEGGRFILTTPNAFCLDFMLQTIFFKQPRVNHYHTHYHSLETICYILKRAGFKIITHEYIQACGDFMNFNARIMVALTYFLPARFGRTLIIVAEKDINPEAEEEFGKVFG